MSGAGEVQGEPRNESVPYSDSTERCISFQVNTRSGSSDNLQQATKTRVCSADLSPSTNSWDGKVDLLICC